MYRNILAAIWIFGFCGALGAYALLVPPSVSGLSPAGVFILSGAFYVLISSLYRTFLGRAGSAVRKRIFILGETRLIGDFVDRLRSCFTVNDLIAALRERIEYAGDGTVFLVDMPKRYLVYNSPTIIGTDPGVFSELLRRYDSWRDGVYFFDGGMDLISDHRKARGFFLVVGGLHCYVFLLHVRAVEREALADAYREFASYRRRNATIEKMFAISAVSREWTQLAETQRSFLPKAMPRVEGLGLAACFKPLVNVSGDYYDAIPLSKDKTLLILGDVSGKGLSAALIMGVVVNTLRIVERKDDLVSLILAVDRAIKGMRLSDKYTVLFLGLIDSAEMKIRYVNASLSDAVIVSETGTGRQLRRMESNCGILGILHLDSVQEDELGLFPGDVVLVASDGVSEVPGPDGRMLGDTDAWTDFVLDVSAGPVEIFVQGLAELAETYSGGVPLRDDITILAAKVGA